MDAVTPPPAPPVAASGQTPLGRGWEVFRSLTVAEVKEDRDFTVGGLLRWILEPLSYMVVYMVLLGAIFNRPREALPIFLLAALIPFRFFTETLFRSMGIVKAYASVITNRSLPREVLPLVVVASNGATFLLSMLLLLPFMIIYDVPFTPALVWVPVVIVILLVLSAGPAYLAAVFGLYFPDYRGAAQNLVRVSFFMSTALVSVREVPGQELPELIEANPLSSIFDSFRAAILRGRMPGELDLLYPFAVGVVLLILGLALYRRRQHQFPKEV
jgi:ABC-type polysaccharide/polyol phosphate export permease